MKLKCYYKFLITEVLLNAWEENRIDVHISLDNYKHVCIYSRTRRDYQRVFELSEV